MANQNNPENKQEQKIIQDLLWSLFKMHSYNIAHRDIKPENIAYFSEEKKWFFIDYGESEMYFSEVGEY